jgi:serine/threonine protein kinase/tetratricopeptide (TPR) repeat protein
MTTWNPRANELFLKALDLPAPGERQRYLEDACAGDAALRTEVDALLDASARAGSFLESPAPSPDLGATADGPPAAECPGTVIGPYKLLEQIGEGGFGVVFMAEQTQPVRRKVALKVLKPGMDTRQVVARFEAERQALALMDHPNIAQVYDGGETAAGRPYFVMELVRGVPITAFCDAGHLSVRQRLELFVSVCRAVQHAHQKGVIHRDLKPTNVLVTLHDGTPVPKVIDFGIAKATGQQLTEKTLFTHFAQMVGTPLYMSPEQAQMSGLDVDTRSDVYSLGVLLYELLTGTTPFDQERLRTVGYDELRRIIREEEPARPSARLSTLGPAAGAAAAHRRSDPRRLRQLVRGELDWIAMKCLEKDRTRRYETANALARDVERYLADEAVEACPPSAGYKLRKFARQHRAALVTAAAFAVLLVAGGAVSAWQAVLARRAEAAALEARDTAAAEQRTAVAQRDRAVAAEEEAQAVLDFFRGKVLAAARPKGEKGGLGRAATIREAVDAAEPGIAAAFERRPAVEAAIRNSLGATYWRLGDLDQAVRQHERALALWRQARGPDHRDTVHEMNDLALVYRAGGRLKEAIALHEDVLERDRAALGPDDPGTLSAMTNLALAYLDASRPADAITLAEAVLKVRRVTLGPDHDDTLTTAYILAQAYQNTGRVAESVPLFEATWKARRAALGPDNPATLWAQYRLATAYRDADRAAEAIPLLDEALARQRVVLGQDHPSTLNTLQGLATAYRAADRLAEAIPLFEEALKLWRDKVAPDHPSTLGAMGDLALAYRDAGRLAEAIPLHEETLTRTRAKLGPDHYNTLAGTINLALAYQTAGRVAEALPLDEAALRLARATLGPDHPTTLIAITNLALSYQAAGRVAEAVSLFEELLTRRRAKLGPDHGHTRASVNYLAQAHLAGRQWAVAEGLFRDLVAARRRLSPVKVPALAEALAGLGASLVGQEKAAEAEPVLREALALDERERPDAWQRFYVQSLLGAALLGQQKAADAEPLLLAGYDGLKQRAAKVPAWARTACLADAAERLAQLYEATGKPAEAAKWRAEQAQKPSP